MADPVQGSAALYALDELPWRVGRKVGRTIYAQQGPQPSHDDPLIGFMDSVVLAEEAVIAHNVGLDREAKGRD